MKEEKLRVHIYSTKRDFKGFIDYFVDIPKEYVCRAMAYLLPHGKPVRKDKTAGHPV